MSLVGKKVGRQPQFKENLIEFRRVILNVNKHILLILSWVVVFGWKKPLGSYLQLYKACFAGFQFYHYYPGFGGWVGGIKNNFKFNWICLLELSFAKPIMEWFLSNSMYTPITIGTLTKISVGRRGLRRNKQDEIRKDGRTPKNEPNWISNVRVGGNGTKNFGDINNFRNFEISFVLTDIFVLSAC